MGGIERLEQRIERAVNGAFAKWFRSEVQPVEIASALRRECDAKAIIMGRERTIVPNAFVVELGPSDYGRIAQFSDAMIRELSAHLVDHARQQRYSFVGPVAVSFEQADDLDTGVLRVRSSTAERRGPGGQNQSQNQTPDGDLDPQPAVPGPIAPPPADQPVPRYAGPTVVDPGRPVSPAVTLDVDGEPYAVTKAVTVIGRGLDADIVLDDAGVSRLHAEVHLIDGRARVIDLGSTNGTFVNGQRSSVATLTDGATITIGRTRIVFHSGDPAGQAW